MARKLIVYKGTKTPCRTCGGTMQCPQCGGEGEITVLWSSKECPRCHATGRCDECERLLGRGMLEAVPIEEIYGYDRSLWPAKIRDL